MRFLIVILIVLLLAWKFWPEQPVPTAEESFIGPQLEPVAAQQAGQLHRGGPRAEGGAEC